MDYCALHHYVVGLTGGVTCHLETEACHIIAGSAQTHEFDSAAACAETERPKRIGATPVDKLIKFANHHVGTGSVEFLYEFVDILVVLEVLTLHAFNTV